MLAIDGNLRRGASFLKMNRHGARDDLVLRRYRARRTVCGSPPPKVMAVTAIDVQRNRRSLLSFSIVFGPLLLKKLKTTLSRGFRALNVKPSFTLYSSVAPPPPTVPLCVCWIVIAPFCSSTFLTVPLRGS